MAYLYYSHKFKTEKFSRLQGPFNIYHWRFIKRGKYVRAGGSEVDGLIVKANQTIFIPHLTSIEDIHAINRNYDREERVEQFHTEYWVMDPPNCLTCWGKGKLDWIEMATGLITETPGKLVKVQYERDPTSILVYPGLEDTIIFGRTQLKEGEQYCPSCHGCGIDLRANYVVFKGMNGIRKSLKVVKTKINI